MHRSKEGTPRAGKFASLHSLRVTSHPSATPRRHLAALAADGTRATTVNFENRLQEVKQEEDSDTMISRHRYALIVQRMSAQVGRYHSVGIFVEAMLRELHENDVDVATRAAAGTWALNLLASQAVGGALDAISQAILPAIYCHYSLSSLANASAAVRAQVRDTATIERNPYFTHSMYMEQAAVDCANATSLGAALHRTLQRNDARRNYVLRTISARRAHTLAFTFKTWRLYVRRTRILRMTSESRSRRLNKSVCLVQLQAAFYQWRMILEQSRNNFLTERLHDATLQLENAKNQFQLQCYRADRFIQSAKETKDELSIALERNEVLEQTVLSLKRGLIEQEEDFNRKLERGVGDAMQLVQGYRQVVRLLVDSKPGPQPYQDNPTDEPATTNVESATNNDSASPNVPIFNKDAQTEHEAEALKLVSLWCDSILRPALGESFAGIRSWAEDFLSGEAYFHLLSHVFPETAPLQPCRDLEYRLRRIRDLSEKCQLLTVLEPEDFLKRREDRIVQSVCELFRRHAAIRTKSTAEATLDRFSADLHESRTPIEVKENAVFQQLVTEYSQELTLMKEDLLSKVYYEHQSTEHLELIVAEEAFLFGERRKGKPLTVVQDPSQNLFWKVNPKSMKDLHSSSFGGAVEVWSQVMIATLQRLLKDKMNVTSRLFYYYAGDGSKSMPEYTFWRFMESSNLFSAVVTKEVTARHFDKVASPQLVTAIRMATFGNSNVDAQTLTNVARQEMDIRHISPTQFVEMLVRIAFTGGGKISSLLESLSEMLTNLNVPSKFGALQALDEFYEEESRRIINFFSDDLYRVFCFYVKQQESSRSTQERQMATQDGGRFAAYMSLKYFLILMDDCGFLEDGDPLDGYKDEEGLTPPLSVRSTVVEDFIAQLQARYACLRGPVMTFTLFLESICVLSYFWCPNPLIPASRRLGAFIVMWMKRLIHCHPSTTLILGTPPCIPLHGGKHIDLSMRSM